jgi:hypothetical protein
VSPSDLNISQAELDSITAALANSGVPDPIGNVISEQVQKVEDYTLKFKITDVRQKRLVRPLVLFQLYSLLGQVSAALQRDYDGAMKELEDIRDGKFPDLALDSPPPADLAPAQAAFGSGRKVRI